MYACDMSRNLLSLLIFVLILIALNFVLGDLGYGVHISIIGSLVLTFVVWIVMSFISGRRR